MTRITIATGPSYPDYFHLSKFLRSKGIDAKLLTRHAVQVIPSHETIAIELAKEYERGTKRGNAEI